ncbi:MAG TPA: tetratricopeptide repeat protein, partial [Trichormus sp.]
IETLLNYYQKRELVKEYPRPTVNMYCCLLYLGRRLADSGQFDESNKLFDKLRDTGCALDHTAVTALFISIEKALNADLAKHLDSSLWQQVFDGWKNSYTDYQSLRALACVYLAAGEYSRAEVMMDYALKLCKNKAKTDTTAAFSTALLYLDKAYLASSRSQFDQAQKYLATAIATTDSMPVSSASGDLDLFNRMFMCRAVQLAQVSRLHSRSAEAEKILKEIVARVDDKKYWLGVFEDSDHPSIDISQSFLYGYYGRVLCDQSKFSEARPYLDKAIAGCLNDVPGFLSTVRARCAAQQGDFSVAAQDLSALVQRSSVFGTTIMSVQPKWKEVYSRMALDYALRAKKFSPDELAKFYKHLGDQLYANASRTEKLQLLKKAYALMSDNSRDKGQLAQEIANLTAMNRGTNNEGPSQVDRAAGRKMQESAAILAEKNKAANAAQLWMTLAGNEVLSKQYDQAIEHIKRAINLQDRQEAYDLEGTPMSVIPDWPIRLLAESGRPKDAEMLYQTLLTKTKDLVGSTSNRYCGVLAELSIFYATQNNREQAFNYLEQLLALDPRKQELGKTSGSARQAILALGYGPLNKDGHNILAIDILEKLLDAQRKTYGSDDTHVAAVLTQIGIVETKNGAYEQAEKHLKEALAIDAFGGEDQVVPTSGVKSAIQDLLEKEHKAAELESLLGSWKTDHKETEKHWSMAANASEERTQEFYDWWHKKAPYSYRSLSGSIKLLEYAVKEKNWERVRELAPECIKILSHHSLLAVHGCEPSPQPATRKFYCFKAEIEACLKSGHADEAHKWLDRAVSEESYEPVTQELIFLSEIENACGNKQAALAYCRRAEGTLPKTDGWNYLRGTVQQLYEKLGSEADTRRIEADARAQMIVKQEEDLRKFETQRKLKAKQKAQFKHPPQSAAAAISAGTNKRPSAEAEDSIEPKESLMFPPVEEIKDKYLFNYAAYASEDLWLQERSYVVRYQGPNQVPSYSFAGSYTGMACFQPDHQAGGFMFLYDGPPGSLVPKFELPAVSRGPGPIFTAPPPVMARPFKAALEAPRTAIALTGKNDMLVLKPGDYTAENISTKGIVISAPGRVRIFLKDKVLPTPSLYIERPKSIWELQGRDKSIRPVFEATADSCINLVPAGEALAPRSSLELWYNGTGEINLDENTHFVGIIYAPNAIIRLGKKVRFLGAMVANKVIVGGGSALMYQTNLQSWVAEPAETK